MGGRRRRLFFSVVKKSVVVMFCEGMIGSFGNVVEDWMYVVVGGRVVGIIMGMVVMRVIRVIMRVRIMIGGIVKMVRVRVWR